MADLTRLSQIILSGPRHCQGSNCYGVGATVAALPATAGATSRAAPGRTIIAIRGKPKLPPASSITFTWHTYVPGFSCVRGTSNWNATAPRSGILIALASTRGVSYTFTPPLRNSMLVNTFTGPPSRRVKPGELAGSGAPFCFAGSYTSYKK